MQEQKYTFAKKQRLSGKKNIETLLSKGEAFFVFPFRIVYTITTLEPKQSPLIVLISIPKKKCKLATNRNRLKRICKEAFRLNQYLLLPDLISNQKKINFIAIYTPLETKASFTEITIAMKKILLKLKNNVESNSLSI